MDTKASITDLEWLRTEENTSKSKFFKRLDEECSSCRPALLFLVGYNYWKFEQNFEPKTFIEFTHLIQNVIDRKPLSKVELEITYQSLYDQRNYLAEVLGLSWLKKYKKAFKKNNEEISLMKKNLKGAVGIKKGLIPSDSSSAEETIESGEANQDDIPYFLKNFCPSSQDEDLQPLRQLKRRKIIELISDEDDDDDDDEESHKLIQELLAEEAKAKSLSLQQERESMEMAIRLQREFDEKDKLLSKQQEESNKPTCNICYSAVEFADVHPLTCGHIFHPECIGQHLEAKTEEKSFPIKCLEHKCDTELTDDEIKEFCDKELYSKIQKFQLEIFLEQNCEIFNRCPTPDCEFIFEWNASKEDSNFKCALCSKTYCIMCRVEWHEGLSCRDYRELKGYPPEDRAFYKFIKGTRFKQCPQCKFWVEKSSGCNHMTCRCGYQFCYRCGGKYRHCAC
ncbi:unnamed protein product [Moneuplotes crassus]|uniref:RBR-type E3 ubiquitin transferase n=1 Tax=Euplotes crassus TaxID=5936 RepID=A0AAD1XCS0_EUPCR|nr:unnamed protein product [Moneuplotes crassus]